MATATKKNSASSSSKAQSPKAKAVASKAVPSKAVTAKSSKSSAKGVTAKGANAPKERASKATPSTRNNIDPDRSAPALAEVDAEVLEFIAAIDEFKRSNGRPFPSWSEVLLVVRQLGYRRA